MCLQGLEVGAGCRPRPPWPSCRPRASERQGVGAHGAAAESLGRCTANAVLLLREKPVAFVALSNALRARASVGESVGLLVAAFVAATGTSSASSGASGEASGESSRAVSVDG